MKKNISLGLFFCFGTFLSQQIQQNLHREVEKILSSPEGASGSISVYVADKNGNEIYSFQPEKGLSTASTQKIFTAIAALSVLGKNYTYQTQMTHTGSVENERLMGDLCFFSNGDPTLGSWRYPGYEPKFFKEKILKTLRENNIQSIEGNLLIDDSWFDFQSVASGWLWEDIGNYYGAGIWGVNWRENQVDLSIKNHQIVKTNVHLPNVQWIVQTQDNQEDRDESVVYTAPLSSVGYVNGKLPQWKEKKVSASVMNPALVMGYELKKFLEENQIKIKGEIFTYWGEKLKSNQKMNFPKHNILMTYTSPTLDKIVYWFMRKSVNLYGEALIKTMTKNQKKSSLYSDSVLFLKDFWKSKGIKSQMINFADGSGLSPQNYVSAKAQVQALLWVRNQPFYDVFYESIPVYNGMKMKSGTIKHTKSFAGYYKDYVFSVILNNYQGKGADKVIYRILDFLK